MCEFLLWFFLFFWTTWIMFWLALKNHFSTTGSFRNVGFSKTRARVLACSNVWWCHDTPVSWLEGLELFTGKLCFLFRWRLRLWSVRSWSYQTCWRTVSSSKNILWHCRRSSSSSVIQICGGPLVSDNDLWERDARDVTTRLCAAHEHKWPSQ